VINLGFYDLVNNDCKTFDLKTLQVFTVNPTICSDKVIYKLGKQTAASTFNSLDNAGGDGIIKW